MATRTLPTTHVVTSRPAPIGARPGGVARAWTALTEMVQARQTRRLLAEMDPRMLADVGLSTAQARIEADRHFWDIAR